MEADCLPGKYDLFEFYEGGLEKGLLKLELIEGGLRGAGEVKKHIFIKSPLKSPFSFP